MPEYACKSKECEGRIFESKPNTARCIYCGSEDIRRIDRPWLRLLTLGAAAISIVFFLLWFNLALSDQQQEDFRNIRWSGCKNEHACNYNAMALFENAEACTFETTIRDCEGKCLRDSDSDGVCDAEEIQGCMDTNACNFDKNATESGGCRYAEPGYTCSGDCLSDKDGDGVCDVDEVYGCTDPKACNYSSAATESTSPSNCLYSEENRYCEGRCLEDQDHDGICDSDEIYGCTNRNALNFNPNATEQLNGSCRYKTSANNRNSSCEDIHYQGYTYNVVKLDGKCWFAENLRSARQKSEDVLFSRNVRRKTAQTLLTADGRVYNYHAVATHNLCPSGWSVVTERQWDELMDEYSLPFIVDRLNLHSFQCVGNSGNQVREVSFWLPFTSNTNDLSKSLTFSLSIEKTYEMRPMSDMLGVRCIHN